MKHTQAEKDLDAVLNKYIALQEENAEWQKRFMSHDKLLDERDEKIAELHKFYIARGLDGEYSFEEYKALAEQSGIKIINKGEQK